MKLKFAILMIALASTGCQPTPATPQEAPPLPLGAKFDANNTGTIRGQVIWSGKLPTVEAIKLLVKTKGLSDDQPNPNAPLIDPKTAGMGQVLVYLRTVDPARSRPWQHPPVEVAFDKDRLDVRQGERVGRFGIVRRSEVIACVSRENKNHNLEVRGASVFSLPLVEPDKITRRVLKDAGTLELLSGTGYYWLRGHLWVGEHPYAVVTGPAGEFEMTEVPAGEYELVCWSPSWHVKRLERHPESGEIERLIFADGVEQTSKISVAAGATVTPEFRWSEKDFPAK